MIRFVPYDEIDKQQWDNCIRQSINGLPYGYTWYLDAISEYWDGLVLDDYDAVFPLTWNEKYGLKYLYQPYFAQQLGVFSMKRDPSLLLPDFLKAIPDEFRLVELNVNQGQDAVEGFKLTERVTHHLNLHRENDEIRAAYSDNVKRNLKKAEKHSLYTSDHISPEELIDLFKENQGKKIEMTERQYAMLSRLMYDSVHHGIGILVGVYDEENRLSGGAFFLKSHHKMIYLFPASDEEARDKGTMHFLIDKMLTEYAGGHTIFDFEGSMIESIARFYKSFGAAEVGYWHLKRDRLPWWARLGKKLKG